MQIKLSPLSNAGSHVEAKHDWPSSVVLLQGGTNGIVFDRKSGTSYRTAFVEAFVDDSFYRGEGTTVEEAETSCWDKYVKTVACPGHEWESRGYKNGAGFCKHCNKFESKRFTPEQLGMYCGYCQKPTFYGEATTTEGIQKFFCEEHISLVHKARLEQLKHKSFLTDEEQLEFNRLLFLLDMED